MIVTRVSYWQIFSNWSVLTSNFLSESVLLVSDRLFSSSFFWRDKISHCKFVSLAFILALFSFAYLSELEQIRIFMVSHRSTGSTSLLFLYSFATSAIVFLIRFTYSLSNKNEVFSFQRPSTIRSCLGNHKSLPTALDSLLENNFQSLRFVCYNGGWLYC